MRHRWRSLTIHSCAQPFTRGLEPGTLPVRSAHWNGWWTESTANSRTRGCWFWWTPRHQWSVLIDWHPEARSGTERRNPVTWERNIGDDPRLAKPGILRTLDVVRTDCLAVEQVRAVAPYLLPRRDGGPDPDPVNPLGDRLEGVRLQSEPDRRAEARRRNKALKQVPASPRCGGASLLQPLLEVVILHNQATLHVVRYEQVRILRVGHERDPGPQ